jgi:small subunit ribosomal protein S5
MGTQNPNNMIKATFDALQNSFSPRSIASKRGKKVGEIVARRDSGAAAQAAAKE